MTAAIESKGEIASLIKKGISAFWKARFSPSKVVWKPDQIFPGGAMNNPLTWTISFKGRGINLSFDLWAIIALKLIKSSITHRALPKVPITNADSFSWITKSIVETEGKPFLICFQLVPSLLLIHKPFSVPKNNSFFSMGSCINESVYPFTFVLSTTEVQCFP